MKETKVFSIIFKTIIVLIGLYYLWRIRSVLTYDFLNFRSHEFSLNILYAVVVYLSSHVLRVYRVYRVADNLNYSFVKCISLQLKQNALNLILPFKLGEAYRVVIFKDLFKSYSGSLAALFIERIFDVVIVVFLLAFGVFISDRVMFSDLGLMFKILILVVTGAPILLLSGQQILAKIHNHFLLRSLKNKDFKIAIFLGNIIEIFDSVSINISKRFLEFLVISILVWSLEITALFLMFPNTGIDLILVLVALIAFSGFLPNGPVGIGGLHLAFYWVTQYSGGNSEIEADFYIKYIFIPALLTGLVLLILQNLVLRNGKSWSNRSR